MNDSTNDIERWRKAHERTLRRRAIKPTSELVAEFTKYAADVTRPGADPVNGSAFYKINSIRGILQELTARNVTVHISPELTKAMADQHTERLRICEEKGIDPRTLT